MLCLELVWCYICSDIRNLFKESSSHVRMEQIWETAYWSIIQKSQISGAYAEIWCARRCKCDACSMQSTSSDRPNRHRICINFRTLLIVASWSGEVIIRGFVEMWCTFQRIFKNAQEVECQDEERCRLIHAAYRLVTDGALIECIRWSIILSLKSKRLKGKEAEKLIYSGCGASV
jgi:hypothetical protein